LILRSLVDYYDINSNCSGALKSNIGHLEGSSGIAGLIKAVLVLEKGIIPPNANFENVNPLIDAEFFNLKVVLS
jgi:acyl transferase domain-containing protein